MTGLRASPALRGPIGGVAACVATVAIVTAAIWLLEPHVPVLSLGVLYVFAVLPVAVAWGWRYAVPVAVASMLAFNFFFLPPTHTLTLADSRNWLALAVYLTTAVVVGSLASRARRRADEAEQREREAALLADVAAELLRGTRLEEELARIEERTADVIGVSSVRIVLGKETGGARAHEAPHPLSVDGRPVATVYTPEREEGALRIQQQLLPALASLLAVARERERLEREAFGAEALRRSDAIKTALIQAVSHDLRTPLATIEQALDGLESGVLALTAGGSRAAAPDDSSGAHAPQAARREPSRPLAAPGGSRRVDPGALDRGPARGAGAGGAPRFRPAYRSVPGPICRPVSVNAVQIQRALVNVLENALRVSPPDEPVHMRVSATRQELLIRVTDRGPGIPEEERERIFEPFHRVPGGPDQRGPGLGLAIARGFAEANGGRLWVESRPGQGASFVLALPAVELPVEVPT